MTKVDITSSLKREQFKGAMKTVMIPTIECSECGFRSHISSEHGQIINEKGKYILNKDLTYTFTPLHNDTCSQYEN